MSKAKVERDSITLKWGSLKAWELHTPRCRELFEKWAALGASMSALTHHDTPEQKQILCDLIDASNVETVYLDWDGKHVSKEEAKDYIKNYGLKR